MANADNLTDYLVDGMLSLPPQMDAEAVVDQILDFHGRQGWGFRAQEAVNSFALWSTAEPSLRGGKIRTCQTSLP